MTFTITEPGSYRTRSGEKVRVICVDTDRPDNTYPILYQTDSGTVRSCTQGGRYNAISDEHEHDLVAEWIRPIVDWSAMPAWAKYVARDSNGRWYWYDVKPCDDYDMWLSVDEGISERIPSDFSPSFSGDWKDSLVERPHA